MADAVSTTVAVGTSSALAPALALGAPPEGVLLFAFLGSIVAVWLESKGPEPLSWKLVGRTLMLMFVSILSGVVGSAFLRGIGADTPYVGMAARVEPWITACIIAALIHRFGPLVYRFANARSGKSENAPSA